MIKWLLTTGCFVSSLIGFSQTGTYFSIDKEEYFNQAIKPWKYQVTTFPKTDTSSKAIARVTFWRSEKLQDEQTKEYWKPNIRYTVYSISDSAFCKYYSGTVKAAGMCTGAKMGGDYIFLGRFILLNPDLCVQCTSANGIDYCRNILKKIFAEVKDTSSDNWKDIVRQFPISSGKFKP